MDTRLTWNWELETNQMGPDYLFQATFALENTLILQTRVLEFMGKSKDFVRSSQVANGIGFTDTKSALKLQLENHGNIYLYSEITVQNNYFSIINGYGCTFLEETKLILHLLETPDLKLESWSVKVGGDGYDWTEVTGGQSALLEYLT